MALTMVLSIGLDAGLLRARNLVLQSAGYNVVSAFSIKEAVDRFQAGDFDLVLLCQSIPANDRDGLTARIRASGSSVPVVCVSGTLFSHHAVSDVTVGSEPGALLSGIGEVLSNTKNRAAKNPMTKNRTAENSTAMDRAASTAKPLDKYDGDAAQMNKAPGPSAGFDEKTRAAKEQVARLSRAC